MVAMSFEPIQRIMRIRTDQEIAVVIAALPVAGLARMARLMDLLYGADRMAAASVAAILHQDRNLEGLLIRVANRVRHGAGIPVTFLEAAAVRLGANRTRSLAISVSAADLLHSNQTIVFNDDAFWSQCVIRGALARSLAMNCARPLAGKAFLAGVLQQAAGPLMSRRCGARYRAFLARAAGDGRRLAKLEWQALGFNHIHVVALLLEQWHAPSDLRLAVSRQNSPPPLGHNADASLRLWQIAYFVGALPIGEPRPPDLADAFLRRMPQTCFGMDAASVGALFKQAAAEYADVADLFAPRLADRYPAATLLRPAAALFGPDLTSTQTTAVCTSAVKAQPPPPSRGRPDRFSVDILTSSRP